MVPLLFFYKDDFGIKLPTKIDMLLNKETKPNETISIYCRYSVRLEYFVEGLIIVVSTMKLSTS